MDLFQTNMRVKALVEQDRWASIMWQFWWRGCF